jgi:glucosylceramidase
MTSSGAGSGASSGNVSAGSYTTVQLYQSSKSAGAGGKSEGCASLPALTPHAAGASTKAVITVDPTKPRQKITGFGGAITETVASTIAILNQNQQNEIWNAYFSPMGLGYTLTRTSIGSCDFSVTEGTYDDGAADPSLANFSIQRDKQYLIPGLKAANAATGGKLKILSSMWSPPAWMKVGNALHGGTIDPATYPVLAKYLAKYVQSYQDPAVGLNIWAITPQNEPFYNGAARESTGWADNGGAMNTFIRDQLGPQLKVVSPNTKIFMFDHNKGDPGAAAAQDASMIKWAKTMYNDTTTSPFLAGAAVHWYDSTFLVYERGLDALHNVDPTKDILFNEGTADGYIFPGPGAAGQAAAAWQHDDWFWNSDEYDWGYVYSNKAVHPVYAPVSRYARDILVGLNHWYTGWIDWCAVLNKYGAQDAAGGGIGNVGQPGVSHIENAIPGGIMVDENPSMTGQTGTIYYTPIFYVMKHFSKFMQPGASVLTTSTKLAGSATPVGDDTASGTYNFAAAAQNVDGSTAVVLFNEKTTPIDYTVVVGAQAVDGTLPAQSMQTLVWMK